MNESSTYKLFSNTDCLSEQTLFDYIDKKLSHKEQHVVEKHLMDCEFCSDALEGLQLVKNRNRINDINKLIDAKIANKTEAKIIPFNYKMITSIAAALVLLIGGVFFFKYVLITNDSANMAELKEESAPVEESPAMAPPPPMDEVADEKALETEIQNPISRTDSITSNFKYVNTQTQEGQLDALRKQEILQDEKGGSKLKKETKVESGYFASKRDNAKEITINNSSSSGLANARQPNSAPNQWATPADTKVNTISSGESGNDGDHLGRAADGTYKGYSEKPKVISDKNNEVEKNSGIIGTTDMPTKDAEKSENNRFRNNQTTPVLANKNAEVVEKKPALEETKQISSETSEGRKSEDLTKKSEKAYSNVQFEQEVIISKDKERDSKKRKAKTASPQKANRAYAFEPDGKKEKQKEKNDDYRNDDKSQLGKKGQKEIVVTKTEAAPVEISAKNIPASGKNDKEEEKAKEADAIVVATETAVTTLAGSIATDSVYTVADEMPQYPGGSGELMKYFQNNIKSNGDSEADGKFDEPSPTIYIQFTINKKGKAINPKVLKNTDKELEKSIIDAVNKMPVWKPGKQNGKIVDVQYSLPIQINVK